MSQTHPRRVSDLQAALGRGHRERLRMVFKTGAANGRGQYSPDPVFRFQLVIGQKGGPILLPGTRFKSFPEFLTKRVVRF